MLVKLQDLFVKIIRNFFWERNFLDVYPPLIVENPGIDPHVHPLQIYSTKNGKVLPLYLITSPEFALKKILAQTKSDLFSLNYSFRDDPQTPIHRKQFLMLEWYRVNINIEGIMQDVQDLCLHLNQQLISNKVSTRYKQNDIKFEKKTVAEIFREKLNIEILDFLQKDDLLFLLKNKFSDIPLPKNPEKLEWDDLYFLLFLNKIEPTLSQIPFLILYEFPAPLSALSEIKKDNPKVCLRFELYISGLEICNSYQELTSLEEQKVRYLEQKELKLRSYGYELPYPKVLFEALELGLPKSCGSALGVERLLMSLVKIENPFLDL